MMRTARGRVATNNAYTHFGLPPPERESVNRELFTGPPDDG